MHTYTLHTAPAQWNGRRPLPSTIHVINPDPILAEWELLTILAGLHGWVCAYDVLMGAEQGSEKDTDLAILLDAFRAYIGPQRMPFSRYTLDDRREKI